jgi:hypothetical protein
VAKRLIPRIPREFIAPILQTAIKKIERGQPLDTGPNSQGDRLIEREIVVTVLQSLLDGKSYVKALTGGGAIAESSVKILREVTEAKIKFPQKSETKILNELAKRKGINRAAMKQRYARALSADRKRWRKKFFSGVWPTTNFWRLTDDDIESLMASDPMHNVIALRDETGNQTDWRTWYQRRRNVEVRHILDATGWKTIPQRDGDK